MFGGYREGKRGWGAAGKVIVLGIPQRDGVVRVFPFADRSKKIIEALIRERAWPSSLLLH